MNLKEVYIITLIYEKINTLNYSHRKEKHCTPDEKKYWSTWESKEGKGLVRKTPLETKNMEKLSRIPVEVHKAIILGESI